MNRLWQKLCHLWNSSNSLSAIGVLAAGLLLAEINFLAARHYQRWDFSAEQEFSISPATEQLLAMATEPLEVNLLLGRADPLLLDLNQILQGYRSLQPNISFKQVDPDRQRTEHTRLLQEVSAAGATPELTDIALVIRYGDKLRSLDREKLVRLATQSSGSLGLEAALSRIIKELTTNDRKLICVLEGHGEKSLIDQGPQGLSAMRRSLQASDISTKTVPLTPVDQECDSLALIGPTQPFTPNDLLLLEKWQTNGRQFLLALDPIVDREGRINKTGLNPFTLKYGVEFQRNFLLERSKQKKLAQGIGEEFLGTIKTHPLTETFNAYNQKKGLSVVVRAAAPLDLSHPAQALITTSAQAVTMNDLQSLKSSLDADEDPNAPFAVVAFSTLEKSKATFWGSSEMMTNQLFGDRRVTGNRILLEATLAQLLNEPLLITTQAKEANSFALQISESDLQNIFYYVLFWMPGLSALTGWAILYSRKRRDQQVKP